MKGKPVIVGVGHYLPPDQVANEDLPATLNLDPAGVKKRTGIERRHWVNGRVYTSDLSTAACKKALEDAGMEATDIDCIVAATLSPNYAFPGIGVYTQDNLGINGIPAYDIRNQCAGFLFSLNIARVFLESGTYRNILLVGAELHSHALGHTEMHAHITPLFGDGGGALVMTTNGDGPDIRNKGNNLQLSVDYVKVFSDGSGADKLRQRVWDTSLAPFIDWKQTCDSPEEFWYAEMDGQYIFRRAVKGMVKAGRKALKETGLSIDDIACVIPHQANLNINKTVGSVLGFPPEKVLSNIERVGNTTAASIPILLSETLQDGKISAGDKVLMLAFGSGLTWGAAILTAQ